MRKQEKSAWVASLPAKTSKRGGGVRSAGRSAGRSAINRQKPHPERPNPRHCCVINIHTQTDTAVQSVRQYPCTTKHVTALTINNLSPYQTNVVSASINTGYSTGHCIMGFALNLIVARLEDCSVICCAVNSLHNRHCTMLVFAKLTATKPGC